MEYSDYQLSVFEEGIKHDVGEIPINLGVNAVAGSGKSTTGVELMVKYIEKYPNRRCLFLAFNKHITVDLKSKVDTALGANNRSVTILTCHAYGMGTLLGNKGRKGYAGVTISNSIKVDKNKYWRIANGLARRRWNIDAKLIDRVIPKVLKMCDIGRLYLVASKKQLEQVCDQYGIDCNEESIGWAWNLMEAGMRQTNAIDFTDMLWLPIIHSLWSFKYDLVIIDEAQDLSTAQRFLMMKAINKSGKFVFFGDEFQAINGFAGSDNDSFKRLLETPNTKLLPLSICYRCGSDIIDVAKHWVPHIEAFEGAGKGVVVKSDTQNSIKAGDLVLCRNTFPLIFLCLKYWSQGVKAYVLGKDTGESLIHMIKHNMPAKSGGIVQYKKGMKTTNILINRVDLLRNNLKQELVRYCEKMAKKHGISISEVKKTNGYDMVVEKVKAINIISKGCENIPHIVRKCESIFSNSDKTNNSICLSTIHKSKGLENDRVFIIHWDLIPSRFARQDWELQQERNLQYVAVTRAKKYLGFVTDFIAYDKNTKKKKDQGDSDVNRDDMQAHMMALNI